MKAEFHLLPVSVLAAASGAAKDGRPSKEARCRFHGDLKPPDA